MAAKTQSATGSEKGSALDRYKARRAGRMVPDLTAEQREAVRRALHPELEPAADEKAPTPRNSRRQRCSSRRNTPSAGPRRRFLLALTAALITVAAVAWRSLPTAHEPVTLTYEIDLNRAPLGALTITLVTEGELPRELRLDAAPGLLNAPGTGIHILPSSAYALNEDGRPGRKLVIYDHGDGWTVNTDGAERAGFVYEIELAHAAGGEQDIRRHISTPVEGGVRAAGFEVFLRPSGLPVDDITVMIHNPDDLPVLVPWPALVRGADRPDPSGVQPPADGETYAGQEVQPAHLGLGQGYRPAPANELSATAKASAHAAATAPVPANLFFHPRDLADLNNALLICGDIRTSAVQTRDCVIQLATDQDWEFRDDAALDLIRRIARTELGFFGSAPCQQITVLLSANRVTATEGFDVYGVHTGSSVLVLMSPETTYGLLEEQVVSVIAHEMFHGWLGEAVRQTDPGTLWFTEGLTTWYSARMLVAAGVWTPDHARETLLGRLERDYVNNDLLGSLTVAEAAGEVMADSEQVRFAYAGAVAASMALDEWLADSSGLQRPLDEVLRHLYAHYEGQDLSREIIEKAVHEVTGVDCGAWLDAHVYGRSALPPLEQLI